MYSSLLSTLLIGLIPIWGSSNGEVSSILMDIAAPVPDFVRNDLFGHASSRIDLSASGVLIMDLTSGQNIYEYASLVERPMASLTKIMTAIIIVENHDLDELVEIPEGVVSVPGNIVNIPKGSRFSVGDLLSALFIGSANDAAFSLALFHSGTIASFVEEMNQRAKALGLKHTSFANPTGLDAVGQKSTPQDLGWIFQYAMRFPSLRERLSSRGERIKSTNGDVIYLTHTHALMHVANSFVIAGKTGTTDAAGECLISVVEWMGRKLVIILLNSRDRYADMRKILNVLQIES